MKKLILSITLLSLVAPLPALGEGIIEKSKDQTIDFFNRHAWAPQLGSRHNVYFSNLGRNGSILNRDIEVVAFSRMIYSNIYGSGNFDRAKLAADFLVSHMLDKKHLYFLPKISIDENDQVVDFERKGTMFIFHQSYPIGALSALLDAGYEEVAGLPLAGLLAELFKSFEQRFRGFEGAYQYYWNFDHNDNRNWDGVEHISYQSVIYPISSFMLILRKNASSELKKMLDTRIASLINFANDRMIERDAMGLIKGTLAERFVRDPADSSIWIVDEGYVRSESGHVAQLSWLLSTLSKNDSQNEKPDYLSLAKNLFGAFLELSPFDQDTALIFNSLDRKTGEIIDSHSMQWWVSLEALIALDQAQKGAWYSGSQKNQLVSRLYEDLLEAYNHYFVDHDLGGEFTEYYYDKEQRLVLANDKKGHAGKSAYHVTEAHLFLIQ